MNERVYKEIITSIKEKFGTASVAIIQRRCQVGREEAEKLYQKYVEQPKQPINNFRKLPKKGALLNKYSGKNISIPFLMRKLGLSKIQTEKLLNDWMNASETEQHNKKFDDIRLCIKAPKNLKVPAQKPIGDLMKERTIARHIKYLESQGYKVEKQNHGET